MGKLLIAELVGAMMGGAIFTLLAYTIKPDASAMFLSLGVMGAGVGGMAIGGALELWRTR